MPAARPNVVVGANVTNAVHVVVVEMHICDTALASVATSVLVGRSRPSVIATHPEPVHRSSARIDSGPKSSCAQGGR